MFSLSRGAADRGVGTPSQPGPGSYRVSDILVMTALNVSVYWVAGGVASTRHFGRGPLA